MRHLAIDWTKHLKEPDNKRSFEDLVRNSTAVLGRLLEIIETKKAELHRQELSPNDYDNPSWAFRQAHRNGQVRGLQDVEDLLRFLKE